MNLKCISPWKSTKAFFGSWRVPSCRGLGGLVPFREGEADEFQRRVAINAFESADKMRRMCEAQFVGDGFDMPDGEQQVRSIVESHFVQPLLRCSPESIVENSLQLPLRNLTEPGQFV